MTEKEWEGHDLRFTDNIAILELVERIKINAAVYPACLNWNKDEKLTPEDGTEGMVGKIFKIVRYSHYSAECILFYKVNDILQTN